MDKGHLIFSTRVDEQYGSYDEAERIAKENIFENTGNENPTDDGVWCEINEMIEFDADEFWNNLLGLDDESLYAVSADIGRWNGRYAGGKVIKGLRSALSKIVEQSDSGELTVDTSNHDASSHFVLYKLTPEGERWFNNHTYDADSIVVPHIVERLGRLCRNVKLRKQLGWI